MNILDIVNEIEDKAINWRRKIHQNPELSSQEFQTKAMIIEILKEYNIEYFEVNNTTVVADIYGEDKNGKSIAFRADIDALPMQEESDYEFASKNPNVAHTCGHDVHTAMLLGTAALLVKNKDKFKGKARLIFQEAEEFGAETAKYAQDVMQGIDAVFAIHVTADLKTGYADCSAGPRCAGADVFHIEWTGESGHGSMPFKAKDALYTAASFVTEAQSIIPKFVDPTQSAVLSCGHFSSGDAPNILPKYAVTDFTFRYFEPKVQEIVHEKVKQHALAFGSLYDVKVGFDARVELKPVINDAQFASIARDAFVQIDSSAKLGELKAINGADDFSEYLLYAPGAMGWLGIANEEIDAIYPLHHEKFKADENAIKYGIGWFYNLTINYLNK